MIIQTIQTDTDRVTLILANNFVTKCRLTMALQQFFLHPYILFNSHMYHVNKCLYKGVYSYVFGDS